MRFLLSIVINALAIWVATGLLPGMNVGTEKGTSTAVLTFLGVGAIFGLVNAVLRPIVVFLSIPLYLLTLGLFSLIVNAAMLWVTARLSEAIGLTFHLDNFFWTAVLGAIIVSVVAMVGNALVPERRRELAD